MVGDIVSTRPNTTWQFHSIVYINHLSNWRMGRDSNPRYLAVHTLSRRAQSTTLAPIRNEPEILMPPSLRFNLLFKCLVEGIKLCFELSLALLNNLQPQLIPVKLDCRVMNMPFDFVHLSLSLA